MQTFLALFRGPDIERSVLVAASVDPDLVARFTEEVLCGGQLHHPGGPTPDPVQAEIESGRYRALNVVRKEARGDVCEPSAAHREDAIGQVTGRTVGPERQAESASAVLEHAQLGNRAAIRVPPDAAEERAGEE